jgi:hypothetical protein
MHWEMLPMLKGIRSVCVDDDEDGDTKAGGALTSSANSGTISTSRNPLHTACDPKGHEPCAWDVFSAWDGALADGVSACSSRGFALFFASRSRWPVRTLANWNKRCLFMRIREFR